MWSMGFITSVVNLFLFLSRLSALSLLSGLSDQSAIRILSEPEGSPSGAEAPMGRSLSRRPNSAMGSEDDRFFNGFDDLLWFINQLKDFQIRG
jgi:hypothetical protein